MQINGRTRGAPQKVRSKDTEKKRCCRLALIQALLIAARILQNKAKYAFGRWYLPSTLGLSISELSRAERCCLVTAGAKFRV